MDRDRSPYGKERAVRILLECILVHTAETHFWNRYQYLDRDPGLCPTM